MASSNNRIELTLDKAIVHSLRSVRMREKGIHHNIFSIIGPPGGGKTMMITALAKKMGCGILSYEPALERMEKFGGIPDTIWYDRKSPDGTIIKELHTVWSVPQMIKEIRTKSSEHKNVVVLFDDWHLCDDEIQKIGFELFTYYSLNGHEIPANVIFILAGNEKSAAGAKVQLSAIRNRSMVIYTKSDPDYWIENYAIPTKIHPAGISFFMINENKDIFHEEESTVTQFASPRSWTSVFNNLTDIETDPVFSGIPKSEVMAIIQSGVGEKAASRFYTYYEIYRHIDTNYIFNTGNIKIPTDATERFAFSSAVSSEFYNRHVTKVAGIRKLTQKEETLPCEKVFANVIKELYKGYPEIAIRCMRYILDHPEDEEFNIKGFDIIKSLIKDNYITKDLIAELKITTAKLAKGAA